MAHALNIKDQRKVSGDRVFSTCEVMFPTTDPFSNYNCLKTGGVVFNVRGCCLYLDEQFSDGNIHKIVPDNYTSTFLRFRICLDDQPDVVISNLKVQFLRIKDPKRGKGLIFKFVDLTEDQLSQLYTAQESLFAIGISEEEVATLCEALSIEPMDISAEDDIPTLNPMDGINKPSLAEVLTLEPIR